MLRLLRAEQAVGIDGSLGCTHPGVFYTQATVDGFWVVLEHGGSASDYRGRADGLRFRTDLADRHGAE